jgi:hypothetical protein
MTRNCKYFHVRHYRKGEDMAEVENPMVNYKEKEPRVVAQCEECYEDLTDQDTFLRFDGVYFCDYDCIHDYLGIIETEGRFFR